MKDIANQTMEEHLHIRHISASLYTSIYTDEQSRIITFLIWNLSGQLVGFQRYRPDQNKTLRNEDTYGRYYTYFTPQFKQRSVAVWGLETYHYDDRVLCLTEGIFDACRLHNHGIPAIAVFSSNPKQLRPWLKLIPRKLIGIEDNDGRSFIGRFTNITMTTNEKDLGDSSEEEVTQLVKEIYAKI